MIVSIITDPIMGLGGNPASKELKACPSAGQVKEEDLSWEDPGDPTPTNRSGPGPGEGSRNTCRLHWVYNPLDWLRSKVAAIMASYWYRLLQPAILQNFSGTCFVIKIKHEKYIFVKQQF